MSSEKWSVLIFCLSLSYFHSHGDDTIVGSGLHILTYTYRHCAVMILSLLYLLWHGTSINLVIPEDQWSVRHLNKNIWYGNQIKCLSKKWDTCYIWFNWHIQSVSHIFFFRIMIVHVSVKHSEAEFRACRENDTYADIRLSSADTLKFASQEFSLEDIIEVENKR